MNSGITIVGKRAQIPSGLRIGRNCVIGPGVAATGIEDSYIPSGTTLRGQQRTPSFTV